MQYSIVIENAGKNFSAYSPDIPGCVATGDTLAEVKENIKAALEMHIHGLQEDGFPIPEPASQVEYLNVSI